MSGDNHNPRIRHVSLEQIEPNEVLVVMEACAGAMGDSGAFELYSIHDGEVYYFYGNTYYGNLDLREAQKHLPEGTWYDEDFCFHWNRKTWEVFGGGMGNVFVIRSQYSPELVDRCRKTVRPRYYRAFLPALEELLLDIASGRSTGIKESDDDSPKTYKANPWADRNKKRQERLKEFLE